MWLAKRDKLAEAQALPTCVLSLSVIDCIFKGVQVLIKPGDQDPPRRSGQSNSS